MAEADVLYLGNDGKIHADEVKRTANAARKKIQTEGPDDRGGSKYLRRMQSWQRQSPDHAASLVVMEERGWALVAKGGSDMPDSLSTLAECRRQGITVEVAGERASGATWAHVEQKLASQSEVEATTPGELLRKVK